MPKPDTTFSPEVVPPPELEKRTRRTFSSQYKRSIIEQADACKHGELGQLLRREKLYSNQLAQWRRDLAEHGEDGLNKSKPGPQASQTAEQKRISKLEKENARLLKQLKVKDNCIELQKKVLALTEQAEQGSS